MVARRSSKSPMGSNGGTSASTTVNRMRPAFWAMITGTSASKSTFAAPPMPSGGAPPYFLVAGATPFFSSSCFNSSNARLPINASPAAVYTTAVPGRTFMEVTEPLKE